MAFRLHRSSYCATLNRSLKTVLFLMKLELIWIAWVRVISQWKKRKRTRDRRSLNDPPSSDMKSTRIDLVLIRRKSHRMRLAHLLFPCIRHRLYSRGWCNPKGTWLTSLWFPMGWCWLSPWASKSSIQNSPGCPQPIYWQSPECLLYSCCPTPVPRNAWKLCQPHCLAWKTLLDAPISPSLSV